MKCSPALVICLWLAPLLPLGTAGAQTPRLHPFEVAAGAGVMTSGAYFTSPGALALSGDDALAGTLEVAVPVPRSFAIVLGGVHAQPAFQLSGRPLIGSVGVHGARLWFADVALRGRMPLGARSVGPV